MAVANPTPPARRSACHSPREGGPHHTQKSAAIPHGVGSVWAGMLWEMTWGLIERYGFLGGMGTAAGVTNFCGLHANVHGEMHRVVQGIASDLLARIDRLDGLNAPHLILGKIFAQAYDTAAYKIAADDLLALFAYIRYVDSLRPHYLVGSAVLSKRALRYSFSGIQGSRFSSWNSSGNRVESPAARKAS